MLKTLKQSFANDKLNFRLLILWVLILSILYSALSILRHIHFESGGFDLGLYDQTIWKYSQFISPYNTIKDRFILGDHLNLTIPLLSPLYYLWNDVKIILIFQAFWISISTFAVYELSRYRKLSPIVSLNISIIYSLFYGIQYAIFFDFHAIVIGVGLIAWFLLFFETRRWKFLLITLVLMLLTQENMGIALMSIGAYYFFKKEYRKFSLIFILVGLGWSLIAAKIIAYFSPIGFQYVPHIDPNPIHLFTQFFDSNEKRQVWFYSFSQYSFLPIFSIGSLAAVVLDLSQYFVTGPEFSRMWSPYLHHRAILAPFLILGLLDVLLFLKNRKINILFVSLILVFSVFIQQFIFHFPLNKLSKPVYWQSEKWMENNEKLFSEIPKNFSIATQQNLVPHLSHRNNIYLIYPRPHDFDNNICGKRSCWWLDFGGKPDYLVVDLHPGQTLTQLLESEENFKMAVTNMEQAKKISKVKNISNAYLYKINY